MKRRRTTAPIKRPSERVSYVGSTSVATNSSQVFYVFAATSAGTLTSMTLSLTNGTSSSSEDGTYCLVYVPEGYNANTVRDWSTPGTFYEPEEQVLLAGIIPSTGGPTGPWKSKTSRKVRNGDRIALILTNNEADSAMLSRFLFQASYIQ